jgi:hypothetical protein
MAGKDRQRKKGKRMRIRRYIEVQYVPAPYNSYSRKGKASREPWRASE